MEGPRGYHTKWSKSQREIQIPHDVIYMWNLKRDINGPTYEAETDWEQIRGCEGGGMDWEFRVQFSSVQLLSLVWLFVTPWIAARQASLSITNSRSSLRFTSIESVMPSSHLILCRPLLLLPPISPSISVQWVNSSHQVAKVLKFQL